MFAVAHSVSLCTQTRALRRGFTLVELVIVIVLLGILSAIAIPRLFSSKDFYIRGFHDETLALLRFAQKNAVAQRRTVCVSFATGGVTLALAASAGTSNCATAATFSGPNGESPPAVSARGGVTYAATPTSFNFNGLGQPITSAGAALASQTFQVSGASASITVEGTTGYVHD
jgi:MSHA pilin protein MshC